MQFDMQSVPWQLDPEPLITTLQVSTTGGATRDALRSNNTSAIVLLKIIVASYLKLNSPENVLCPPKTIKSATEQTISSHRLDTICETQEIKLSNCNHHQFYPGCTKKDRNGGAHKKEIGK